MLNSIEDLTDYTYIYVEPDRLHTNAFMKTEEQKLKHLVVSNGYDVLDKIPLEGLNKIMKASKDNIIFIVNAQCNLINGKTIMQMLIESNCDIGNVRLVSKNNNYRNYYKHNTNTKVFENISIDSCEAIKECYVHDSTGSKLLTLTIENMYKFRNQLNIEECNKTFLEYKRAAFHAKFLDFKDEVVNYLNKSHISFDLLCKAKRASSMQELNRIMMSDTRVQDEYTDMSKRINTELVQSQQDLTMCASPSELTAFDTITSLCGVSKNVFDIEKVNYYRLSINQLILNPNSSILDTIDKIAKACKLEKNEIIQKNFDKEYMIKEMQAYFNMWRNEMKKEANNEALKDYKYKLLCILKALNKHGILIEEISKLLTLSFFIPNDIDRNTALQLIFDLFKQYGIYDTIWRVHILPLNEFRRVFTDYTDNKTIYLKEIA